MSKKRILSMVLAALMSFSLLPANALAATTPQSTTKTLPVTLYDYGSTNKWNAFKTTDTTQLNEGLNENNDMVFGGSGLYALNNCYNKATGNYLDQCIYRGIANRTVAVNSNVILSSTLTDKDLFSTTARPYKKVFTNVSFPFSFNNQTGEYFFDSAKTNLRYTKSTNKLEVQSGSSTGFWPFGTNNTYFGLSMNLDFNMPVNGLVNGAPMVYQFSGDDDLWVYIDEKLTLDVGGIHYATHGAIDFAQQKVWYGQDTKFPQGTNAAPKIVHASTPFELNGVKYTYYTTFAEVGLTNMDAYTAHKMRIYYLERGAGQSNNMMRFNLPTFTGNPNLTKVLGRMNEMFVDAAQKYQFMVKSGADENSLQPYTGTYALTHDGRTTEGVTIKDGLLEIQAGDIVAFDIKSGHYVQMSELYEGKYDKTEYAVTLVGGGAPPADGTANAGSGKQAPARKVGAERLLYTFTNGPTTGSLKLSKVLAEGSTATQQEFAFKVLLTSALYGMSNQPYVGVVKVNGTDSAVGADGTLQLKAGDQAVIEGLPAGTAYRIEEEIAEGYQLGDITVSGDATKDLPNAVVTGTIKADVQEQADFINVPTISVKVVKEWKDANDEAALATRGESINCTMGRYWLEGTTKVADTTFEKEIMLTKADEWQQVVQNLPERAPDGKEYHYTIKQENPVNGYEMASVQESIVDGVKVITLTNRRAEAGEITVVKHWLDGEDTASRPETLPLTLHRGVQNGTTMQEDTSFTQPAQPTPTKAADQWTYTYKNLDLYSADGTLYHYWVSEGAVAGYEAIRPTGTPESDLNLYNRKLADITVQKIWQDDNNQAGLRPAELKLQLLRGIDAATMLPVKDGTVTVSGATGWSHTFAQLPAFDANGTRYLYAVAEPDKTEFYTMLPQEGLSTTITNVINAKHSVTVRYVEQGTDHKLVGDIAAGTFYETQKYDVTQATEKTIAGYTRVGLAQGTAPVAGTMGDHDLLIIVEYAKIGTIPIETRYREVTLDANGNFDRTAAKPIDGIVDIINYYLPGEAFDASRDPALTEGYRYLTSENAAGNTATEFKGNAEKALTFTHYFVKEANTPVNKVLHTYYHLHRPLQGATQLNAEGQQASGLSAGSAINLQELLLAQYESFAYLPQTAEVIRTKLPQTQTQLDALVAKDIAARVATAAAQEKAAYDEKLAVANAAAEDVKAAQKAYDDAKKAAEDALAVEQQKAVAASEEVKQATAAQQAAQALIVGLKPAEKDAKVLEAQQVLTLAEEALAALPDDDAGKPSAQQAVTDAKAALAAAEALPADESYVSQAEKADCIAKADAAYAAAVKAAESTAVVPADKEQAVKEAKEKLDAATIAEVEASRLLAEAKTAYQQRVTAEQALYAEGTEAYAAVVAKYKETAAPASETIYTGPTTASFEVLPDHSYLVKLVYQRETAETVIPTPTPTPTPSTPPTTDTVTTATAATLPKTSASRAEAAGSIGMLMLLAGTALRVLKRKDS